MNKRAFYNSSSQFIKEHPNKISTLNKLFVQQQDQSDCGIACLLMVLSWHGAHVKAEDIRIWSGTNKKGTSLLGLSEAAKHCHLEAIGVEMDMIHLKKQQAPCILHTLMERNREHYVVYFSHNKKGQFLIGDPSKEIRTVSEEELQEIWKSGVALILKKHNSFKQTKKRSNEKWTWFKSTLQEDYSFLGISLFFGIVIAFMGLSTAIFTQILIDELLPADDSTRILMGIILLTLILLMRSVLVYIRQHFVLHQSRLYNERLTGSFFDKLLYLPNVFFDSRQTGDLITRLNDTQRIQRNISYIAGTIIIDVLMTISCLILLFFYSWQIALVVLLFTPPLLFIVRRFAKPIRNAQQDMMRTYGKTESNYIDTLQGVSTIKSTASEEYFSNQARTYFGHYQAVLFKLGTLSNRFNFASEISSTLLSISLISFSAYLVLFQHLTIGEMIAILTITASFIPAISRLAQVNFQVEEIRIAFNRMYEFIAAEPESRTGNQVIEDFQVMEVKDISFGFNEQRLLFEDFSLQLNKGELIAITGDSGSGKSTLMQLLLKFYAPKSGKIKVNHHELCAIQTQAWRLVIGYVPQEVKLFNGSLYYNIVLDEYKETSNLQDFHAFCVAHGFDAFFQSFPQGYQTQLGEEGVHLSGGEKQLLALARALYKRPSILLLDEATSAMDQEKEVFVFELLNKLKKDMGILMISHNPTLTNFADRIYNLDQNRPQ